MDAERLEHEELLRLAAATMPFGKYAGRRLIDLPEAYILWFKQKGYPAGTLGRQLEAVLELKLNGLEHLLRPLSDRRRDPDAPGSARPGRSS